MAKVGKAFKFKGTPKECVAWLRSYLYGPQALVRGADTRDDADHEFNAEVTDALKRGVYEISVTRTGLVASHEVRPELAYAAERIETGVELFDLMLSEGVDDAS